VSESIEPSFIPAAAWNREYRERVADSGGESIAIEVRRGDTVVHRREEMVLRAASDKHAENGRYVERIAKFLLWKEGGDNLRIEGADPLHNFVMRTFSPTGPRGFDHAFFSDIYSGSTDLGPSSLGGHRDGCRIGFDLGASDRKCAAVKDGEVIHTEEVPWDPSRFRDPKEHYAGILDSLTRAAAHLPRVDAIGGSVAGVFAGDNLMMSSLFRGISPGLLRASWPKMTRELREHFGGIPFQAVNDGSVSALAGADALGGRQVLGLALGSSLAGGYVGDDGRISQGINELAFVPIDYSTGAPVDEWSGDRGCAVQYLSQQGTARMMDSVGLTAAPEALLRERLLRLQELMEAGDEKSARVFSMVGNALGHAIAHFSDFYPLRHVVLLGRVMTGSGGTSILNSAQNILASDYPSLKSVKLHVPDERERRHGQAVAAASLPALGGNGE